MGIGNVLVEKCNAVVVELSGFCEFTIKDCSLKVGSASINADVHESSRFPILTISVGYLLVCSYNEQTKNQGTF